MLAFDLIALRKPDVTAKRTKIHLASWNGFDNPLDVYFAGGFSDWQEWQTRENFKRDFVLSLIALPSAHEWLLAGVYESLGSQWIEEEALYKYNLKLLPNFEDLSGRLVIGFSRTGRQPYLNAENWCEKVLVREYLRERLSIAEFPGYRNVDLSRAELETIVDQSLASWRTALSNVAGIYLISDTKSGLLYVGSASGEGGIWQRWNQYRSNGHGGNTELRRLFREKGSDCVTGFRYSILEIADVHLSEEGILARESHWKRILMSRTHGLNAN